MRARPRRAHGWLGASALSVCALAHTDDSAVPTVTPYRPTVSNPADLPAPGWLEGEFWGLFVHNADRTRVDTAPLLLKYAFDDNTGLLFGGNAWDREPAADGRVRNGFGDTLLEWKQRFPVRHGLAFGLEAGGIFPTAPRGVGIGKPAWIAAGIVSADLGAFHLDLNAGVLRATQHLPVASDWQANWAAALSHPLGSALTWALEFSGDDRRGSDHSRQVLAALSWQPMPRLELDVGLTHGYASTRGERGVFAGGTVLLGRLR